MHEMSIATELLREVLAAAEPHAPARVTDVEVAAGELQQIVPEALEAAWHSLAAGTPAEGAVLHLTETPIEARCRACGRTFRPDVTDFACPGCGQADVDVVAGRDIILTSLTCEAEDEPK